MEVYKKFSFNRSCVFDLAGIYTMPAGSKMILFSI